MQHKCLIYNDFYRISGWTPPFFCANSIIVLWGMRELKKGEWHGKLDHSRLGRRHFRCSAHIEPQHVESGIGTAILFLYKARDLLVRGFSRF